MQVVVYCDHDGTLIVLYPSMDVTQVALKDVPFGLPFWIIDADRLPSRECRQEWYIDSASLSRPDGYGANYGAGTDKEVVGYDRGGHPRIFRTATGGVIANRSTRACQDAVSAVKMLGATILPATTTKTMVALSDVGIEGGE